MMFKSPRTIPEIQNDYNVACAQLGQVEFRISMLQRESTALRESLINLDYEAGERNKMDAEAKAKEQTAQSTPKLVELADKAQA